MAPAQESKSLALNTAIFFLIYLIACAQSESCLIPVDVKTYLEMNTSKLFLLASGGKKIGVCFIHQSSDPSDNCDLYVRSGKITGADYRTGWPREISSKTGSGCVKAPDFAKQVSTCIYGAPEYGLSQPDVDAFCTGDGRDNAVAQLKHAIANNACGLPSVSALVPCAAGSMGCACTSTRQGVLPGPAVELPSTITLDRVKHCSSSISCRARTTRPEYGIFGEKGMNERRQKGLFISQVITPAKESTENIVFVVAGQQFHNDILELDGYSSGLTGQHEDYAEDFKRTDGSRTVSINSSSLANEIMKTGYFQPSNTFVGLVFDARFNYEYSRDTKNRHLNGYYDYLRSKMGPHMKTIYLAGHSRGGCLVMRLASRLVSEFPNTRIIVHNYDGICGHDRRFLSILTSDEFEVEDVRHYNPLRLARDYYVCTTDIDARFKHKNCLAIRAFLVGEKVIANGVRAFGHRAFVGSTQKDDSISYNGFLYYMQSWEKENHGSVARNHHGTAALHLKKAMQELPAGCGA